MKNEFEQRHPEILSAMYRLDTTHLLKAGLAEVRVSVPCRERGTLGLFEQATKSDPEPDGKRDLV